MSETTEANVEMQPTTALEASPIPSSSSGSSPSVPAHDTFPQFRTLPKELRLKVFKHALPLPSILRVKGTMFYGPTSVTFKVETASPLPTSLNQQASPLPIRAMLELGLLGAHSESRAEYQRILPHRLGPCGKCCVYFGEEDIIYIENLEALLNDYLFERTIKRQPWVRFITVLYMPAQCFLGIEDIQSLNKVAWEDLKSRGLVSIMRIFTQLQKLIAVYNNNPGYDRYFYDNPARWNKRFSDKFNLLNELSCVREGRVKVPGISSIKYEEIGRAES